MSTTEQGITFDLTNQAVYKFHADCGRMGTLEGIFVQRKDYVQALIDSGIEVYFGEVLGKHSEIYGALSDTDFTMVSDEPQIVKLFLDNGIYSGFDPFDYSDMEGRDILDIIECMVDGGDNCKQEEE